MLIVITDKEIINQKFFQDKLQLDLTSKFYQGEEMDLEKVETIMPTARHLHLTGKNSVNLALEKNLVQENKILYVDNIPHAEVVIEQFS